MGRTASRHRRNLGSTGRTSAAARGATVRQRHVAGAAIKASKPVGIAVAKNTYMLQRTPSCCKGHLDAWHTTVYISLCSLWTGRLVQARGPLVAGSN